MEERPCHRQILKKSKQQETKYDNTFSCMYKELLILEDQSSYCKHKTFFIAVQLFSFWKNYFAALIFKMKL